MSTEQITKFQPDRTLSLRGFTGFGAAASLCETSPTGFKVHGVFRDQADFCVLIVYDADNVYEHYSLKYLPDFDLSGMVLNFSLTTQKLQPIDSAKYSWIDWAQMDVVKSSGEPARIRLWDYATLRDGSYSVAQGSYTFAAPGGCGAGDRLTLFVNNVSFTFEAHGGETADDVARYLASRINSYDWASFVDTSVAVMASTEAGGRLTLKNARSGRVNVEGRSISWQSGTKFAGIAAGSALYLDGAAYVVSSVESPRSLSLTGAAPSGQGVTYLAEYGGLDGNDVQVYMLGGGTNQRLSVDRSVVQFSGGNSDDVTWHISLDFTALGIDDIRQAWLTFAPQLAPGAAYNDSEWTANFTNWSLVDPKGVGKLQCAGPGSMRVGNSDGACTYSGAGWSMVAANNYWRGFGYKTGSTGDSVTVTYRCAGAHDLYLGTSLFKDRGTVSVTLDGASLKDLDCFLNVSSEVVTRRILQKGVAGGTHTVTLTLLAGNHQAAAGSIWDVNSLGYQFLFDYIEAAIRSDLPDAMVTYPNMSAALDFDTDATYKVSPQRLLWHLRKLGLMGQMNEYVGVYWWNQRRRVGGISNSAVVTFGGTWAAGDIATIMIGGFAYKKKVVAGDTSDTIASHFVYYINSGSVGTWAEKTGAGQLTIHVRTPNWNDTFAVDKTSATGTVDYAGNLNLDSDGKASGLDGRWEIDATAASPMNFPVRQWHADLFKEVAAAGMSITTAFSMELVNPPDDGRVDKIWKARFYDGTVVDTATDFNGILSSQCAPIPNVTNFQKAVYKEMAGLQSAAGLTPWLQFGEFVWWYFCANNRQNVPVGYAAYTSPISVGLEKPHGLSTGDRVIVSGVQGMTSANGTWLITKTDETHFTLDSSSANGDWVSGSGTVSGASMAFYDPITAAAARAALGRELYKFTCQDDDPSVNGGADVNFLAGRLKAHVDAIRDTVLTAYPNAKFELLYPNDVNNPVCYVNAQNRYPQGGRLNAAVNLPAEWRTKAGSGLDRIKVEALSWGATYRNFDLAAQAVTFAFSGALSWGLPDVAYLIPWFNGACPWTAELQLASSSGMGLINFWAYDHLALMSWPVPFPASTRRSCFGG